MIKDSGNRTEFSTGAVRDMHEGKGRFDLLPWNAIHDVAKHCEEGAIKYGEHNVDKGIPQHSLIDSAIRHLSKYIRNDIDEDHLRAACWNLLWALEQRTTHPELNDLYYHQPPSERESVKPYEPYDVDDDYDDDYDDDDDYENHLVFERKPVEDDKDDPYADVGKHAAKIAQAMKDITSDHDEEEDETKSESYKFLTTNGDYHFVSNKDDTELEIAKKYINEVLLSLSKLSQPEADTIVNFIDYGVRYGGKVTFLEFMNYFCDDFLSKCLNRKEPKERWLYGVANVNPYQLVRYYWTKKDVDRIARIDYKDNEISYLYIPFPTFDWER